MNEIAGRKLTALRRLAALGVFAVNKPVQKLRFLGNTPVMRLALGDVVLQVSDRADIHGLDAGDLPEALDFPPSKTNLRIEMDHGRSMR